MSRLLATPQKTAARLPHVDVRLPLVDVRLPHVDLGLLFLRRAVQFDVAARWSGRCVLFTRAAEALFYMARGGKKVGGSEWTSEQLASLVQVGAVFSVWTADYEASDLYPLLIEDLASDGAMTVSFPDGDKPSHVRCTAASIERGQGPVFLSQKQAVAGQARSHQHLLQSDRHSPPFLLSRTALGQLKAGQSVLVEVNGGRFSVTRRGEGRKAVRIGDEAISVRTLHAQDDSETAWSPVDLWVLDHPQWPIIMQIDFGGECELSLFEVHPAS